MRKLVSVRKIKEIKTHKNADLLEIAIVDGWQCVVKKGEFKEGDYVAYFEIDSFLPLEPEFEFLKKSNYKKMGNFEGIRLRTIRLRGEFSQGLLLQLYKLDRFFEENPYKVLEEPSFELGKDITKWLGVKKYEQPIPAQLSGNIKGVFPEFIKKTDQERIQNLFDKYSEKTILEKDYTNNKEKEVNNPIPLLDFEVSLKLDGTSCTMFICNQAKFKTKKIEENKLPSYNFGVCSRNYQITPSETNTYWEVARNNNIERKLADFYEQTGRSIALQGEIMGPGIQKNREKLNNFDFYIFDIWDIDNQKHLLPSERVKIVKELGLLHVPIINSSMKVFSELKSINDFLKFAEGESINNHIREGVVFKTNSFVKGTIISFKAISNIFLLKGGD